MMAIANERVALLAVILHGIVSVLLKNVLRQLDGGAGADTGAMLDRMFGGASAGPVPPKALHSLSYLAGAIIMIPFGLISWYTVSDPPSNNSLYKVLGRVSYKITNFFILCREFECSNLARTSRLLKPGV
jgi:hypothetical protein